jgi:hypothetical protein
MRKYGYVLVLVFLLSACFTVTPVKPSVVIAPGSQEIALGAVAEFTATLAGATNFAWSITPQQGTLTTLSPSSVRLVAPTVEGTYTLRAVTADVDSLPGEVTLTVTRFANLQTLTAVVSPALVSEIQPLIRGVNLAPNASALYAVNVTEAVAQGGLGLYFETNPTPSSAQLGLTVYNPDRSVYASSSSPTIFARGLEGLPTPASLQPQGIATGAYTCLGPCAVRDSQAGTYYVEVKNFSAASAQINLFGFTRAFADTTENANDANNASTPTFNTFERGAIETLGDVDYYRVTRAGNLSFSSTSAVDISVTAFNAAGTAIGTIARDASLFVPDGTVIEVKSASGNLAGPGADSQYNLSFP